MIIFLFFFSFWVTKEIMVKYKYKCVLICNIVEDIIFINLHDYCMWTIRTTFYFLCNLNWNISKDLSLKSWLVIMKNSTYKTNLLFWEQTMTISKHWCNVLSVNRHDAFNGKFTTTTAEHKHLATGVLSAFMHCKIFAWFPATRPFSSLFAFTIRLRGIIFRETY